VHTDKIAPLENMYEFMTNDFSEMKERTITGYNHPTLNEFKKSSNIRRNQIGQGIGLLKMKMGAVKDEGYPSEYIVIEFVLEMFIAFFGKIRAYFCQRFHFRIKINIKMLGF